MRVCTGLRGSPTPAEWERNRFNCRSLLGVCVCVCVCVKKIAMEMRRGVVWLTLAGLGI